VGIDRSADRLPAKFFRPLTGSGPTAGVALDEAEVGAALDEYYRLAGWDPASGNPTSETLTRLGLAWIA
jgi:aldehyde:ferredoxin oxidoreductase